MTHHRVFSAIDLAPDSSIELTGEQAHYLGTVLRLKPHSKVNLFDARGFEFPCTVQSVARKRVKLQIGQAIKPETESPLNVWLVQSVVRGERMDYCVQKATELGVREILPVLTERSVVRLTGDRAQKRRQHWHKIAISACEQSGRVTPPRIHTPQSLEHLVNDDIPLQATLICLHPTASRHALEDITHTDEQPLVLFVGPEGGFDEREQEILRYRGAHMLALGRRVLRSETAGIVALALCQHHWGDLG